VEGPLFSVYASAETLDASSLGGLRSADTVNLERALAVGDRLGGHIVSGHVDAVGRIQEVRPAGESKVYRVAFPQAWAGLVVPKGSVALDGVSLTVNACGRDFLEVNIIPATLQETTIPQWQPGIEVNMEFDVIGKYVQRLLTPWQNEAGQGGQGPDMDWDFLRRHGFA
jgi:riboflavin synthase